MRVFSVSVAALLLAILGLACNTVSPDECWVNTSGGFGGSEQIPIGAGVGATTGGDYATPPRRPLDSGDEPNPCIMQEGPCGQKCLSDYETSAIACGKIADEAQSHACSEGARQIYKSCEKICQQNEITDCRERCKKQCDKANIKCIDKCPKGDKNCMNECNQENGRCLKDCDEGCK